jgi:integrase
MAGKQAKLINSEGVARLLRLVACHRHAERDRAIVLLSLKAGLRACEIAGLTWSMLLDLDGRLADVIELRDAVAKQGGGRTIPIHPVLRATLCRLLESRPPSPEAPVIASEHGEAMRANSIVNFFVSLFRRAGLEGCSSHSGRRTFITRAARTVHRVGGSLRDVQQLAGHASIEMTQRYIEGDTRAKRALVRLL